ncbi:MAG: SDR family NAD(P)-dependent oxidoreductase, partial [Verrucomicrobia bacterium]|nr:SDR family NAD(P)-dependent oxidoreductase [Verrucomicrobiota bacterium]
MVDKITLITGALGDIGFASAKRMATMGMKVILSDIQSESEAQDAVHQILSAG